MKNIDWVSKLTSRKFWSAIIGFVTAILLSFGVADNTVTQVIGIITAGATLIAYIISEGFVDAANVTVTTTEESEDETNG